VTSRKEPSPRLRATFDDWAVSLAPPACPNGHGPMVYDPAMFDEVAHACRCESEVGAFVCETCAPPEVVAVGRLVWRDPRCRLSASHSGHRCAVGTSSHENASRKNRPSEDLPHAGEVGRP